MINVWNMMMPPYLALNDAMALVNQWLFGLLVWSFLPQVVLL